jgi:hypothetical protein
MIYVICSIGYVVVSVITAVMIGREMYWHSGYPGQWGSYDDHVLAMVLGSLSWPIFFPYLIAMCFVRMEPKAIREARKRKELEQFAKREGLTL